VPPVVAAAPAPPAPPRVAPPKVKVPRPPKVKRPRPPKAERRRGLFAGWGSKAAPAQPVVPPAEPAGPVVPAAHPVVPEAAPFRPVVPEAAPFRPVAPEAAPFRPVAPEAEQPRPVVPEAAPFHPVVPTAEPSAVAPETEPFRQVVLETGPPSPAGLPAAPPHPAEPKAARHRAVPAAWSPKVWRSNPVASVWWQPLVLVLALLLAVAMLLMPQAVRPRTIEGTPVPAPAPPSTGALPAVGGPAPAELPDGAPVTPSGTGSWDVVPGATGAVAGTGPKQLTYTVEIEGGLDVPSFATDVDAILADPRGWTGPGEVSFRRIDDPDADPAFRIGLTSPETSRRPDLCGFEIPYDSSCHLSRRHRIVVNLARWIRGAHAFDGDLASYREYAINHEVGHALGFGHVGCPATGAPAPVMMQQTFGLSNSYLAELNRATPGAAARVHPDGAVCRPNPWVTPDP
jgi:hypothetical protein